MKWLSLLVLLVIPRLCPAQGQRMFAEQCVYRYARQYRIPPELIAAFIDVESNWNPRAVSNKGAMGLMQLMPATARRFGALQPFDPEQNIAAGTRYITMLMWEFHGEMRLVAAAYYAGDKWVGRRMLDYRNPDVIAYVEAVRWHYALRKRLTPQIQRR
jgi:soluble lytic murein transglycosylase-like protein